MPKIIPTLLISCALISGLISSYSFSFEKDKTPSHTVDNKNSDTNTEHLLLKIEELSKKNDILINQNRLLNDALFVQVNLHTPNSIEKITYNNALLAEIRELKKQLENKASNNTLEILSKSFYERLRTTDDSVSMWGTITGWFGVLITLVLASMALLHFGRFRELKNETKNVLKEARMNSRISANEAITRAGNEANKLVHNWLNEKGIKEIENKISEFNSQIDIAKDKISNIDGTLAVANNSIDNIKERERTFLSLPNKKDNSADISKLLNILPSERTVTNTTPLLNIYLGNQEFRKTLDTINTLFKTNDISQDEEFTLNLYKSYTLSQLGLHNQCIIHYLSTCTSITNQNTFDEKLTSLNVYALLNSIIYSFIKVQQYSSASEIIKIVFEKILSKKYKYPQIEYLVNIAIKIDQNNGNKALIDSYLPRLLELFQDTKNINYRLERAKIISEIEIDHTSAFDVQELISKAHNTKDLLNAYVLITDHYALNEKWELSLKYFDEINSSLTKDQKRTNLDTYLYLILNRAFSLGRMGKKQQAYRIGNYVKQKSERMGIVFDQRGNKELEETLKK